MLVVVLLLGLAGALVIGAATGVALVKLQRRRVPRTDRGRRLDRSDPAHPYPKPWPAAPVPPAGKTVIDHAARTTNCIGFTFGLGNWQIDTAHVPEILADGYHGVAEGKARVCNVVVWGDAEGGYDHAALVVEVSPAGVPTVVRGKAATSRFIYEHAPATFGPNYEVYERNTLPPPGTPARITIDALQTAYNAQPDKTTRAAHDIAAHLCQLKNALPGA